MTPQETKQQQLAEILAPAGDADAMRAAVAPSSLSTMRRMASR